MVLDLAATPIRSSDSTFRLPAEEEAGVTARRAEALKVYSVKVLAPFPLNKSAGESKPPAQRHTLTGSMPLRASRRRPKRSQVPAVWCSSWGQIWGTDLAPPQLCSAELSRVGRERRHGSPQAAVATTIGNPPSKKSCASADSPVLLQLVHPTGRGSQLPGVRRTYRVS